MLSAKQVRAIALLLELADVKLVASEIGVTSRAVRKWLVQEEFAGHLRRARDIQIATFARENARGMARMAKNSRETIEEIMNNKNRLEVDAQTRLRAAIAVQDKLSAIEKQILPNGSE